MATETAVVIIAEGHSPGSFEVHHRDFPEIRAEGGSPETAATHLSQQLTRALDSALTKWRRESFEKAIKDVETFATHQP